MPVNNRIDAHLQYPTQAEAEAASAWIADWVANTPNTIRGTVTNEVTDVVNPPTDEGCNWQVNATVHLTCPDQETMDLCQGEWADAVYGGGVAEAQCNSNLGSVNDN